ncbi:hypothetical protein LN042_11695 [Kitasatospora sp. RB6PN24]|uniref:SAV_915 family protein n=1 Tax=Kitasatospora humi TaxID=2893891 RepID=UPI001E5F8688|nr:SAV_915 family protein [Kitasatospora humi]MCC9307751.1 hypothetical protein [Kitasatospora humi]
MYQHRASEDPEPSERVPAGQLLVPVRSGPLGHVPCFFRLPLGDRTAVAFTSELQLRAVLGPAQPWIALAEPALRALAEPLGVTTLTVDPQLVAPAPRRLAGAHAFRSPSPCERRTSASESRQPAAAAPAPRPDRAHSR